jgi:hypothetical protein
MEYPEDLLKHLVVHGFSELDAVEALEAYTLHGYWKSPHGSEWGEKEKENAVLLPEVPAHGDPGAGSEGS